MTHLRKKYLSVKVTLNTHLLSIAGISLDDLSKKLEIFCANHKDVGYLDIEKVDAIGADDFGHEVRVISSDHNQLSEDAMKIKVISFLQSQLN
jgi:hypothetical protein